MGRYNIYLFLFIIVTIFLCSYGMTYAEKKNIDSPCMRQMREETSLEFSEMSELGRFVFVKEDNVCASGIVTGL